MKLITFIFSLLVLSTSVAHAQSKGDYKLSTHVLNTYEGIPAEGVAVELYQQDAETSEWILVDTQLTDHDGRVNTFLDKSISPEGIYKLKFFARDYFSDRQDLKSIFPYIEVVVELGNESHYHIPITISPLSYGTYKGK